MNKESCITNSASLPFGWKSNVVALCAQGWERITASDPPPALKKCRGSLCLPGLGCRLRRDFVAWRVYKWMWDDALSDIFTFYDDIYSWTYVSSASMAIIRWREKILMMPCRIWLYISLWVEDLDSFSSFLEFTFLVCYMKIPVMKTLKSRFIPRRHVWHYALLYIDLGMLSGIWFLAWKWDRLL